MKVLCAAVIPGEQCECQGAHQWIRYEAWQYHAIPERALQHHAKDKGCAACDAALK